MRRAVNDPDALEEFRAFVRGSFWRAIREALKDAEPDPDEVPEEPETIERVREFLRTTRTDE